MGKPVFEWRSGGYPQRTVKASDIEELRAGVLNYVRQSRSRLSEPRCGHCGKTVSEESLIDHTTYRDPADGPGCGQLAAMGKLLMKDSC
jgi:hypothetical protein